MVSRSEEISKLLKTLTSTSTDVDAAALIDNDGLTISAALPTDVEEDRVAAMSAALLEVSDRIVHELGRGLFELVMVRVSEGYTILARCGQDAVLSVLTTRTAKLGLVFLDASRSAKEVARQIS